MNQRRHRPMPEVIRSYQTHARLLRGQLQVETTRADRAEQAVRDLTAELERERRRSTGLTTLLAAHGLLPTA